MTNIFDITEFGAVGDGKTDSTSAIQSALDAAAKVEGVVIVPPGRYLSGTLHMGKRTRIEGKSGWSFRSDGLSVIELNDDKATCLIDITGAFGCSLSGICLDGGYKGNNVHGIYLYWDKYNGGSEEDTPCIDDCRVGRFTGDGVHLEHIWCYSIRHSQLHRNKGAGLYMDGWDAFILDNWFSGNMNCGILGGPCVASVTITGNRVEWNRGAGFDFYSGESVQMTGNFFDRSFGPAVKLGGNGEKFRDCSLTGNIFRRSGCPDGMNFETPNNRSHVWFDGTENITMVGNVFRWGEGDGPGGTKSPDYDIIVEKSTSVVIQGNTMMRGALKDTIIYDGEGKVIIKDNIIDEVK